MARRLLNLMTALSLLLCVAVCVLWVRGHFRVDYIGILYGDESADGSWNGAGVSFWSDSGQLALHSFRYKGVSRHRIGWSVRRLGHGRWYVDTFEFQRPALRPLGFGHPVRLERRAGTRFVLWDFQIGSWLLALLTLAMSLVRLASYLRCQRRRIANLCPR